MGLTVFLSMSTVMAANAVEEVGTFGVSMARGVLPTGRAGVGWTVYPKMTGLLTFKTFLQREAL